jgi:hypothetical protein
MSVGCEFKDKLERARDLMSHANPSGELATVLERALDLLVEKLEKQRFAQTKHPRAARRPSLDSRATPNLHASRPPSPDGCGEGAVASKLGALTVSLRAPSPE